MLDAKKRMRERCCWGPYVAVVEVKLKEEEVHGEEGSWKRGVITEEAAVVVVVMVTGRRRRRSVIIEE